MTYDYRNNIQIYTVVQFKRDVRTYFIEKVLSKTFLK